VPEGEWRTLGARPNVMKVITGARRNRRGINTEGWFNTATSLDWKTESIIEGRTKELIVRFGMNVYPAGVEAVLNICGGKSAPPWLAAPFKDWKRVKKR